MVADDNPPKRESFLTTSLYHRRKLHIAYPTWWSHHAGGWGDVTRFLDQHLSCADGALTLNSVEETLAGGRVLDVPWVGFAHETPRHSYAFPDLERLLQLPAWKASVGKCRGLWVLSSHNKDYLDSYNFGFPISFVHYPTAEPAEKFSYERFIAQDPLPLIFIGEYLRRRQPFFDLIADGYQKIQIDSPGFRWDAPPTPGRQPVTVVNRVCDQAYNHRLARSVVFLHLQDAGANTTIVECIARGTPVLVNRVGGVAEYLGDQYPFYYEDLDEASEKLADLALIEETSRYLLRAPVRERLTFDNFKIELQNTAVYRSLPVPSSQRSHFPRYDLTILICTYKRINCLAAQLQRLSEQNFPHSFEILIWNNSADACEEIQQIVDRFSDRLTINVISSGNNLYCTIRFAAPAIMQSDLLMICDDDVMPGPNYLQTFWAKHQHYGPRSVICARGHTFLPHRLDADQPDRVWREQKLVSFYDEAADDREIHYFHADNCMLSRDLLKEAAAIDIPVPEYILIDDYWLSYVVSHLCNCSIWKIKTNDVLGFDLSADDARIAMFQNSLVREQRVNFYIYHMQRGWPFAPPEARQAQDQVLEASHE